MLLKKFFLNPNNGPEGGLLNLSDKVTCKHCNRTLYLSKIRKENYICPYCNGYVPIRARRRILMLADRRSFKELDGDFSSENIISFPGYEKKLEEAKKNSRENEAVICGTAEIAGNTCAVFSMDPYFMMGSMGTVVGEKITRLFEYATEHSLPVVGVIVSGGARMQEGIFSLMQMSKVSAAVRRHSDFGNLYIALLTDPTTGGVDASFAMQADIILAEPHARIGFAGPRLVRKTINKELPKDFQMSESVMDCGFVDIIADRKEQTGLIGSLLMMHRKR